MSTILSRPEATQQTELLDYNFEPANFWLRLLARIIDFIVVNLISSFFFAVIIVSGVLESNYDVASGVEKWGQCIQTSNGSQNCLDLNSQIAPFILGFAFVNLVIHLTYYCLLPLTKLQATIGKLALGLKIVNSKSEKITLVQSLTREIFFIFYYISSFLFIIDTKYNILLTGSIFIASFESSQALITLDMTNFHDKLSKTRVVAQKPLAEIEKII